MDDLTIAQVKEYTGYSRPTLLKWLNEGKLKGSKGIAATDTWFIPINEAEKLRLERIEKLNAAINKISQTIPGNNV